MLLGFPAGYTQVTGVEPYQREQMVGNTMHVMAVQRILTDLPLEESVPHTALEAQPVPQTENETSPTVEPREPLQPPQQQQRGYKQPDKDSSEIIGATTVPPPSDHDQA